MLATSPQSEVVFTVPGETVPWARVGGGKSVVRFIPKEQRSYMGVLKLFAQRAMHGRAPLQGPLELSVQAIYLRPKTHTRKRREAAGAEWKSSKPDADNISKIIKDALNKIAWVDDAQIASLHVWKQYGEKARLTVKIVQLGGGLC
jgi:Holliday junction resolvase RusA-like endonuclease